MNDRDDTKRGSAGHQQSNQIAINNGLRAAQEKEGKIMKNSVKVTVLVALFALATTSMFAATATSTINVSANVANVCTISTTTNLAFGAYDPVFTNAVNPKFETAPAAVSVSCTKGTLPTVTIAGPFTITNGTDTLIYSLFSDLNHTTAFGTVNLTFALSKAPQLVSVWGLIPGGQDVSAGSYLGTATAQVNY